jgi:hypothetical protein
MVDEGVVVRVLRLRQMPSLKTENSATGGEGAHFIWLQKLTTAASKPNRDATPYA